ncbi:hypothetical protein D3C75_1175920 [compost metagenome]
MAGQVADYLYGLIDGQRQAINLRQAAVDGLLAVRHLLLCRTHFSRGLFSRLGHVLHGVGHLIDCSGHLVHL